MRPGQNGLALIQILFIVMAIGITASVVMMNMPSVESSGGSTVTWQRIDAIKSAVASYRTSMGSSPATLDALTAAPAGAPTCAVDTNSSSATYRQLKGWCGPYLANDPMGAGQQKRDGWHTLLQYNGTTLTSCGPNRKCGDGDDITITP